MVALLCPIAASGQAVTRDSAEYARAESLFWRADTLASSGGRAQVLQALALWREAAAIYEVGQASRDLGHALYRIAGAYSDVGVLDSALAYYVRALSIRREEGYRSGEARTLNSIGNVQANLGRPDSALAYYARALPILREVGNRTVEATTLNRIGVVQAYLGRPDSALAYYAQALPIWREVGNPGGEATTLNYIGNVQANLGRPDSVLAYLTRALPIWREVGNRLGEAATLNSIGAVHDDLGRPDSALAYYARALPIQREIGNRGGEAATLSNIGVVQANLGRPDSALAYYARALPILRGVGNRGGEATTLGNIGVVQRNLGRPDSALAYYARALPIQRKVGNRGGEGTTLNNIGAVQEDLGRLDSALVYYVRALPIAREVGDRGGEAATLNNIGLVHAKLGRPDSALAYYARALPILRGVGNRGGEAATLNNIGLVQSSLGRPDSALAYYARALPIRREVGDRGGEATTLSNIGGVHYNLGRPDSALAYYARVLPIQRDVGDRRGEALTRANIGYLFLRSTDDGSARSSVASYDSAATVLARMRRSAGGDANAVSFSEGSGPTFVGWSRAWQLLAEQARTAGDSSGFSQGVASSLAAAERGRAQALRDLLDRGLGADVTALDATDTIPGADLTAEAGRLLAPLRSSRTALLYYLTDGDTLRTWFLNPGGELAMLPPIANSKVELTNQVATARGVLGADAAAARQRRGDPSMAQPDRVGRDGLGGSVGNPASAVAALQALSAGVLPTGLESLLPPGTELVIVPHGALGQVPFAALTLPGDTIPLGARNPLRYSPSLRALVVAEATIAGTERRALVVGDPLMPEVRDESGASHKLSALPGAAEEGRWVATKLGTRVLTGAAASESAVRSSLSTAWIVHLATHGLAYGTEARVRDSYVALAPGAGQDGLLTLGEILDDDSLRLTADLIVLSACQTGLGEARDAEGTVGLQRGLLAKGARSVLVSLWSVDDAATRLLMERFYTHWLGNDGRPTLSKAQALRLAQNDVRATKQFASPRYWAAFQLVGAR